MHQPIQESFMTIEIINKDYFKDMYIIENKFSVIK